MFHWNRCYLANSSMVHSIRDMGLNRNRRTCETTCSIRTPSHPTVNTRWCMWVHIGSPDRRSRSDTTRNSPRTHHRRTACQCSPVGIRRTLRLGGTVARVRSSCPRTRHLGNRRPSSWYCTSSFLDTLDTCRRNHHLDRTSARRTVGRTRQRRPLAPRVSSPSTPTAGRRRSRKRREAPRTSRVT